jgi:hypothetical protein
MAKQTTKQKLEVKAKEVAEKVINENPMATEEEEYYPTKEKYEDYIIVNANGKEIKRTKDRQEAIEYAKKTRLIVR